MDCVVNKVFYPPPVLSNLCEIGRNGREIHRQTDVESRKRFSNILKKKKFKTQFSTFPYNIKQHRRDRPPLVGSSGRRHQSTLHSAGDSGAQSEVCETVTGEPCGAPGTGPAALPAADSDSLCSSYSTPRTPVCVCMHVRMQKEKKQRSVE